MQCAAFINMSFNVRPRSR